MKCINLLSLLIVLVGAINWGLWGLFQFDLIAWFAHSATSLLARFLYVVVGLAGVWGIGLIGKCRSACCSKKSSERPSGGCCGGDRF